MQRVGSSGRRSYGFAITPVSLRDISPIRGISSSPTKELFILWWELRFLLQILLHPSSIRMPPSSRRKANLSVRLTSATCLLRYPKLFARYSLRTILTATPTHTPFIRHRRRSHRSPAGHHYHPIQTFISALEALQ